jgi:hypothetical protein
MSMRDRSSRKASVGLWATLGGLVLACALFGWRSPASGEDTQALLDKVIAAHGGMEAWVALKDLSFRLTLVALTPQGEVTGARASLYRLKRHGKGRVETVTGDGLLIEGFDGERPWATLNGRHLTEPDALKRAHFQAVNWWYWMGIPFKMRDPGVILRQKEPATFQGKPVHVLEVTYALEGPTDRFTYHVDPETYHIVLVETELKPGVWPGVGGSGPGWSTWQEYRTAGPFVMHTKRTVYANRQLTERRAIVFFGDFKFNTGLPDSLFRAP